MRFKLDSILAKRKIPLLVKFAFLFKKQLEIKLDKEGLTVPSQVINTIFITDPKHSLKDCGLLQELQQIGFIFQVDESCSIHADKSMLYYNHEEVRTRSKVFKKTKLLSNKKKCLVTTGFKAIIVKDKKYLNIPTKEQLEEILAKYSKMFDASELDKIKSLLDKL